MGNSNENLQKVSAGEGQAIRKYLFFAEKADESGQRRRWKKSSRQKFSQTSPAMSARCVAKE
jgi:rubrerythrin